MIALTRTLRHTAVAAAVACASGLAVPHAALAIDIPPGGAASLPGGSIAGTVVRDTLVPFEIRSGGGAVIMEGVVQDRVIRTASGDLAFVPRLRDVKGSTPFGISQVVRTGFESFSTDVNWLIAGLGTQAPTWCARSGDGNTLDYSMSFAPVYSGQESKFFWASTDAEVFNNVGGRMTIRLENGLSTTVVVSAPVFDDTPPQVAITSPGAFDCGCNPMEIRGTILDPESGMSDWTIEHAADSGGPWTTIASGSGSIGPDGVIANWNTSSVPEGDRLLRLTATNGADITAVAVSAVFVDKSYQNLELRTPELGRIYGGNVCFDGTADDHCPDHYRVDWRPATGGSFQPVEPSSPTYAFTVINDPLAGWDTRGLTDGDYQVRLRGVDSCGNIANITRTVTIDNTRPVAEITAPAPCDWACGTVEIRGTATDANLRSWSVQYTGGAERGWRTIASGTTEVIDGVLAEWDTTDLERCAYTIRLVVSDEALVNCVTNHTSSDYVSINIGAYADCDGNGSLDIFDFLCFQNAFAAGPCP